MIALMVVTDGCRDECLRRTVDSARTALPWDDFDVRVIVTDSPHAARLGDVYGEHFVVADTGQHRAGFAGTIQAGWRFLQGADHVFHLEDDHLFNRPVPLARMRAVLDQNVHLAQVALLRQAWNAEEKAAGSLIGLHPADFERHSNEAGDQWLEHDCWFTTNPSIYRGDLLELSWPQVPHSEGVFTHQLRASGYRFGYWGTGEEWVEHIGLERTGNGY